MTGYALSKSALSSLVRSLAIDFAPYGTRVNGVIPGAVRTRMLTDHLTEDEIDTFAQRQLIPYIAMPEEIAGTVVFLTSNDAKYITGQNFVVDGGVLSVLAAES